MKYWKFTKKKSRRAILDKKESLSKKENDIYPYLIIVFNFIEFNKSLDLDIKIYKVNQAHLR